MPDLTPGLLVKNIQEQIKQFLRRLCFVKFLQIIYCNVAHQVFGIDITCDYLKIDY